MQEKGFREGIHGPNYILPHPAQVQAHTTQACSTGVLGTTHWLQGIAVIARPHSHIPYPLLLPLTGYSRHHRKITRPLEILKSKQLECEAHQVQSVYRYVCVRGEGGVKGRMGATDLGVLEIACGQLYFLHPTPAKASSPTQGLEACPMSHL